MKSTYKRIKTDRSTKLIREETIDEVLSDHEKEIKEIKRRLDFLERKAKLLHSKITPR